MSLPRILIDASIVSATPESLRADARLLLRVASRKRDEGKHWEATTLEIRARRLRTQADKMESEK